MKFGNKGPTNQLIEIHSQIQEKLEHEQLEKRQKRNEYNFSVLFPAAKFAISLAKKSTLYINYQRILHMHVYVITFGSFRKHDEKSCRKRKFYVAKGSGAFADLIFETATIHFAHFPARGFISGKRRFYEFFLAKRIFRTKKRDI